MGLWKVSETKEGKSHQIQGHPGGREGGRERASQEISAWKGDEVEYRNLRLNYAPQGDSSFVIVFVQ